MATGWKGNPPNNGGGRGSDFGPALAIGEAGSPDHRALRVLVVDEHHVFDDRVESILHQPGIEIAGIVRTVEQAFSAVTTEAPDVVLLVWANSKLPQFRAASALRPAPTQPASEYVVLPSMENGDGHSLQRNARMVTGYLTPRERQVLALLIEGATNKEMAKRLCIRSNTVRTHVQNVLTKLRVHTRLGAVTLAIREGMATPAREALL